MRRARWVDIFIVLNPLQNIDTQVDTLIIDIQVIIGQRMWTVLKYWLIKRYKAFPQMEKIL